MIQLLCGQFRDAANLVAVHVERTTDMLTLRQAIADALSTPQQTVRILRSPVAASQFPKMLVTWTLDTDECFGPAFAPKRGDVHVLVAINLNSLAPPRAMSPPISAVTPQVPPSVWSSIVRISTSDRRTTGTAFVLDRTATHVYLLTNFHLWIQWKEHMSDNFRRDLEQYEEIQARTRHSSADWNRTRRSKRLSS